MKPSSVAVLLMFTLFCSAISSGQVSAATYDVVSCKEAERETLPTRDWQFEPSGADFEMLVDCTMQPITLRTRYGTSTPYGTGAGLTFTVPAPLSIVGAKYRMLIEAPRSTDPNRPWWWTFDTFNTELDGRTYRSGGCSGIISSCSDYFFNPGWQVTSPRRAMTWFLQCTDDAPNPCPGFASVSMFDGTFTINDPERPRIMTAPTGSMFAGGSDLSGDQVVAVDASDGGSGVYRADVEVDGSVAGSVISSAAEYPNCTRPFRVVQPCPPGIVNGVTVDTTHLTDGPHEALLRVYDATEENYASYGPVRFSTANRRLANFCDSDAVRKLRVITPRSPLAFRQTWGYRARIADAAGWEAALLRGTDRVRVIGSGLVSPNGYVAFKVSPGTNRLLRLAIRPPGSRGAYRCGRPTWLRVRPKVRLSVSPEDVSNGRSVRLRGRLLGEENNDRSIVVQARAAGSRRWATVRVVRTNRRGIFTMKYRFLSTFRTVTYVFRAQVRSGKGFPYATGTSRARRVRVFGP